MLVLFALQEMMINTIKFIIYTKVSVTLLWVLPDEGILPLLMMLLPLKAKTEILIDCRKFS